MDLKQEHLTALSTKLDTAIKKALEDVGVADYEIESVQLKPRADMQMASHPGGRWVCEQKGRTISCHFVF